MSQLQDRIQTDLSDAMRQRDAVARDALRMLTAALTNARIEARAELDEDAVLAVVQKQVKQRRESIAEFEKAGRQDLVQKESGELDVLARYLPAQAEREEIEAAARKLIEETGASSARDIGKVMPPLVKQFAGRADGRQINDVVRQLLG
jgi:uncharacterized protein YqeY